MKAIVKRRNHQSVLAITGVHKNWERFTFSPITLTDVTKQLNISNSSKAIQEANLAVKLLNDSKDFFTAYTNKYFNDSLKSAKCKVSKFQIPNFPSWDLLLQFSRRMLVHLKQLETSKCDHLENI